MTLVDLSDGMLAVSRQLNPECEHHLGDMRTVRLGRTFDAVWVTGRIVATGSKRSVEIVDGSADIDVGYSLRANLVEPYQE